MSTELNSSTKVEVSTSDGCKGLHVCRVDTEKDDNVYYVKLSNSTVVWNAPENSDASRVLAQHAFVTKQRGKWYEEKYEGNESLCGRIGIANRREKYITVDEIDKERFDETKACKQCVRIARQRHYL